MTGLIESLLLRNLFEVFGERDQVNRTSAITSIWAADGVFIDPEGTHTGHEALAKAVEQLLQRFPDFVFQQIGQPQAFHGIGRIAWGFGPPDALTRITGLDVLDSDSGKIPHLFTSLD